LRLHKPRRNPTAAHLAARGLSAALVSEEVFRGLIMIHPTVRGNGALSKAGMSLTACGLLRAAEVDLERKDVVGPAGHVESDDRAGVTPNLVVVPEFRGHSFGRGSRFNARCRIRFAGSRVVTVSSIGHRIRAAIHFGDLQWERRYSRVGAYGQAELANLLFTYELRRRLAARGTSMAHPPTPLTRATVDDPDLHLPRLTRAPR
jgi:NAD(P)-dependent dehydrogenase (short-subunit alcohol dehydrogenase family)